MVFSIVDIETTGGSPKFDRVVEIGIVQVENGVVINRYQQLFNPQKSIPLNVQLIHGISNEEVEQEPFFEDLAGEILEILGNSIFVAHAVQFDYGFIKAEMERAGLDWNAKRICTARLGRRLLPQLKSHSLGNLCRFFQIENKRAHRALEDAEATAELWFRYGEMPEFEAVLSHFLKRGSREMRLMPQIEPAAIAQFPAETGIYRFYDQKGKIIYVGKALNLRERVSQHLFGQTHTREKSRFIQSVCQLDYEITGSELMALLLENELIKKYYPRFNSTNKAFNLSRGLFLYPDQNGFHRLQIGPVGKWTEPLVVFTNAIEAHRQLLDWTMQFGLCLKLNGLLEKEVKSCNYETELGQKCLHCHENVEAETYNQLVSSLMKQHFPHKSILIKTLGRSENECGVVWLDRGKLKGYGFCNRDSFPQTLMEVKEHLTGYYDTTDSQAIIRPYLAEAKVIGEMEDKTLVLEVLE